MGRLVVAVVSFFVLFGAALAAEAPPPVTDWDMEVVVVEANAPGPAMWRIRKGDSEIWILGTVGLMPEKLAWNSKHLEETIDGANAVLLPPIASAGVADFLDMSWFILTHWGSLSMPDDEKLEPSLAPDLRARFVAIREGIKKDADRYEDRSPLVAGFVLFADYTKANHLAGDIPEKAVEKIARSKHVKVRRIAEYSAIPMSKEMLKLPPEAGRVCLANGVGDIEVLEKHAVPAAEAWAVGDVAGIKANYSTSLFKDCVAQSKKFGEIDRRAVADSLNAIHEALSKPGKTVMVIDIGWLFRSTGVADQLKSEGVTIEQVSGIGDQASETPRPPDP